MDVYMLPEIISPVCSSGEAQRTREDPHSWDNTGASLPSLWYNQFILALPFIYHLTQIIPVFMRFQLHYSSKDLL